jgi:hypothetical protein
MSIVTKILHLNYDIVRSYILNLVKIKSLQIRSFRNEGVVNFSKHFGDLGATIGVYGYYENELNLNYIN